MSKKATHFKRTFNLHEDIDKKNLLNFYLYMISIFIPPPFSCVPSLFFFPPKIIIYLTHTTLHSTKKNQPGQSLFGRSLSYSSAVDRLVTKALANLAPLWFLLL